MGSNKAIQKDNLEDDGLLHLRVALHFPEHLCTYTSWPWASRGSSELVLLYLKYDTLTSQQADYCKAVSTLGQKDEILTIQKEIATTGEVTGLRFTKKNGEIYSTYFVQVGCVRFGDYRDGKWVVNHKFMAVVHKGLFVLCLRS